MKKTLSVVLVLAMLSAFFCFAQSVVGAPLEDDIPLTQIGASDVYYSYDLETKTLTVSGEGAMPDFVNVDSGEYAQPWYDWRSDGSIENVTVGEGVTSLGNYAFYGVTANSFSLPSTLEEIGKYALAGVNGVSEIVIPSSVKKLNNYAFYFSASIERVVLPMGLTTVGSYCFEKCTSLSSVTFCDMKGQISVNYGAFLGCSSLKEISFPKGAKLGKYAYGYQKNSAGKTYDDVLMRVYRDSAAYDYAQTNLIDYEFISAMELFEGESVERTFYSDNVGDGMVFTFTPNVTAVYDFYSSGSTDVDCRVENSLGELVTTATDNSNMDLNFTVTYKLNAGEEYSFIVSSVRSEGDFTVSLYPHTVSDVGYSFAPLFSAVGDNPPYYDVLSEIEGESITVTFDTGYSEEITFSQNTSISILNVAYTDNQSSTPFTCGVNTGYLTVGSFTEPIEVTINHSYACTVVEPTFEEPGYTRYTCISCGDSYYTDYQNRLGILVTGRVLLAETPDGDHSGNYPIAYAKIKLGGEVIATADGDGYFSVCVGTDVQSLVISTDYSYDRIVSVTPDEYNAAQLGDIALVNFDIYRDGYVNAKDYAQLRQYYGEYNSTDKAMYQLDYNRDGVIDDNDFIALGAYPWGKLTETVYN